MGQLSCGLGLVLHITIYAVDLTTAEKLQYRLVCVIYDIACCVHMPIKIEHVACNLHIEPIDSNDRY